MRQSIFILAMLLGLNATASSKNSFNYPTYTSLDLEKMELEDQLFNNSPVFRYSYGDEITVESIIVITLEEESDIDFDTSKYLPEGFNALKGKNDIDWSKIELIQLDEEVDLGFDPKDYLPKDFNPFKGMHCNSKVAVVSIH